MNVWQSIVAFFQNLGKTVMADIITALPEVEQDLLAAFTNLINAAIAYVVTKYGGNAQGDPTAMSPADKLTYDNQRHNDAFNYVKTQAANEPGKYPAIPDSLLHTGVELYYQKHLRSTEGNGGNLPGGNSGPETEEK